MPVKPNSPEVHRLDSNGAVPHPRKPALRCSFGSRDFGASASRALPSLACILEVASESRPESLRLC